LKTNSTETLLSKEDTAILVIGPNLLQNKLMVEFLEQHTGLLCSAHASFDWPGIMREKIASACLFLLDAQNINLSKSMDTNKLRNSSGTSKVFFALFNSDHHMKIEKEALARGFQGIFYNEDSLESLARGSQAILKGELWFPRKILFECLNEGQFANHTDSDDAALLTFREKEILLKMLTGAGNKKIADDLCISPHTVKTHIYNIYKKLNINNRLQATLWAAKHL
jgi:LuxR family transcriptional regulator of csgAB operon